MSKQEDTDFIVEQKVTNTVGVEVYRDVKRLIKLSLKGIVAIVVIFIVYINYMDSVNEKKRKAAQLQYDKQNAIEDQQRKQAELARRIDLPIAWNGSDKWRNGMKSWGNAGFVFTPNEFIVNIDSKRLTKEQKAMLQGKRFSCYMGLQVGDYSEDIVGFMDHSGSPDDARYSVPDTGYITNDMFLHVKLNVKNADERARSFEAWDLKCGDLVSKVEYNKKGN